MLYDDPHAVDDPNYMCDVCLDYLYYDEHGNKKGDFQAYHYLDRTTVI